MKKLSPLSIKMKEAESLSDYKLNAKVPVLARIDGKAFHTLTKNMKKPFDENFHQSMINAAKELCENISGVKIAYVQSDEISLLLTDYDKINTQPWFNYELRKCCSVSASIATGGFLVSYMKLFKDQAEKIMIGNGIIPSFDSRFWNLDRENIFDYFKWRQIDCIKNSKMLLGQSHFSHKQLHGKNTDEVCQMLLEKNISWDKTEARFKYGTILIKENYIIQVNNKDITRNHWVDKAAPLFDLDFIGAFVNGL